MKIGIITINSAYNYGCVFQAWALQRYLEKIGHDAEIINYRPKAIDKVYRLFVPKKRFRMRPLNWAYNRIRKVRFTRANQPRIKKAEKFEHFISDVMKTTEEVYYTFEDLCEKEAGAAYDALITGSDQVWNSVITVGYKLAYFLDFEKTGKPKLAYASSIGRANLSNAEKDFLSYFLSPYTAIAVRERSARDLLQSVLDRPVELVLDPTLLLERSDYDAMKVASRFKQPYILVHAIGKDKRLLKIAAEVSTRTGLPIVQNRMAQQFENELGNFADAGPQEFLGLIEGAEMVITNSFHATVFSIIYGRNFITIPHRTTPERMANLLEEFGLSEHLIGEVEALPENPDMLMPDYEKVYQNWNVRRTESQNVLQAELELAQKQIELKQ